MDDSSDSGHSSGTTPGTDGSFNSPPCTTTTTIVNDQPPSSIQALHKSLGLLNGNSSPNPPSHLHTLHGLAFVGSGAGSGMPTPPHSHHLPYPTPPPTSIPSNYIFHQQPPPPSQSFPLPDWYYHHPSTNAFGHQQQKQLYG